MSGCKDDKFYRMAKTVTASGQSMFVFRIEMWQLKRFLVIRIVPLTFHPDF